MQEKGRGSAMDKGFEGKGNSAVVLKRNVHFG